MDTDLQEWRFNQSSLDEFEAGGAMIPLSQLDDDTIEGEQSHKAACEILNRVLAWSTDGLKSSGIRFVWRTKQVSLKPGWTYIKDDAGGWPVVEIRNADGHAVRRYDGARIKWLRPARASKKEKNPCLCLRIPETQSVDAAKKVGIRIITLANFANAGTIRGMTGSGVAEILGVTRQAVSLHNKATEQRIKDATGSKTTTPGLRARPDPRKGRPARH